MFSWFLRYWCIYNSLFCQGLLVSRLVTELFELGNKSEVVSFLVTDKLTLEVAMRDSTFWL